MTTTVFMLLRSREVKKIKVDDKKDSFRYREGKYILEGHAINAVGENTAKTKIKGGKTEVVEEIKHKGTEIIYFEGNSTPVFITEDAETLDSSLIYLGHYVAENALKQTGNIPSETITQVFSTLKNTMTIENMAKAAFVLVIGGSILWGYLVDYGIL